MSKPLVLLRKENCYLGVFSHGGKKYLTYKTVRIHSQHMERDAAIHVLTGVVMTPYDYKRLYGIIVSDYMMKKARWN